MGSLYKSHKTRVDGTKREVWTIDYLDTLGKRIRRDFKTKAEATIALAKVETEIDSGTYVQRDKTLTFEKIAKEYMDMHARIHCKPSTIKGYSTFLSCHLLPTFGTVKLIDITPRAIETFISLKLNENLSPKSINNCLTLMGSILQRAVNNNQIPQNAVLKVRRLSIPYNEMRVLNIDEVKHVLSVAKEHYSDFYPLLFTAIFTGMRRGELLGLTWDRINWTSRQIHVLKNLYAGKLAQPKTPAAIRKINMPDELVKVLKEWKLKCPISDMNLVFPNSNGQPMDADNMVKRRFEPVLRKAGIDKIRFHDLRHTFVSMLIAKNIPVKYIQKQVGHTSIQVTMDRYGHLLPEVEQQGVTALNDILSVKDGVQEINYSIG